MKRATLILFVAVFVCAPKISAQAPATGLPLFGSFEQGSFDTINRQNLNVFFAIPIVSVPTRGQKFQFNVVYNSLAWIKTTSGSTTTWTSALDANGTPAFGWFKTSAAGHILAGGSTHSCRYIDPNTGQYAYSYWTTVQNFQYVDWLGTTHPFPSTIFYTQGSTQCGISSTSTSGYASDNSGFFINASPSSTYVLSPAGVSDGGALVDTNGNYVSQIAVNSTETDWTDTTGNLALKVINNGANIQYEYQAPTGGYQTITMLLSSFNIKTNFGCSGIVEYSGTANLPTEIDLPDGSKYTFTYEATPGFSGYYTGRVKRVTLPTGGYYEYDYSGANDSINCSDGTTTQMTRLMNDGTNTSTWQFARTPNGSNWTTAITYPQLPYNTSPNTANYFFNSSGQQTNATFFQGGSTLIRSTANTWASNGSPATIITTLENGATQTEIETSYDNYTNLLSLKEHDWGSGSPGPVLRTTTWAYLNSSAYTSANILNRATSVTVYNGAGTQVSQTKFNYDETAVTATSGTPQHSAVSSPRGNLTSINYPVSGLTAHFTYYDTGTLNTSTDVNGAVTTNTYGSGSCGNSFPTSVSEPLGLSRSMTWNCAGGVMTSVTDENNQVTSTTYNDPYFWRPASINFPDGGQTSWAYNSQTSTTTATKMNASQSIVRTTLLDGLGRTSQTQINSDPQGTDSTVTTYDALGRTYQVYNPTRCNPPTTNCGESTWGIATYAYDALSRPTSVTLQDGSVVTALYSSNITTVTDPAGKKRQSTTDGLGRVTQITEDPGGLGYTSVYGFDALRNLISVVQNGSRQRTYGYDGLSRLTSETNPESGTVSYKFDADSNCSSPNSFAGQLVSRTDARGIRTCFQYDALNRLTNKNYSDGTPAVTLIYDKNTWSFNETPLNAIGRVAAQGSSVEAQYFSYDARGRTTDQWDCFSPCSHTNVQYDQSGNINQLTYPSGRVITQQYNGASLPTQITFASINGTSVGFNYLSSATYAPQGGPATIPLGNGLTETTSYNQQLQLSGRQVASSILTALNRSFGFTSGQNNGNVMSITDNLQPNRTQSFSYDSLNRLYTAQSNATSGGDCWAQQFGYDAWGNLLTATPTRSGCPMTALNIGVNANNQMTNSGLSYDAAGNLLTDGNHSYSYDAEGRVSQVDSGSTATYSYGPSGQRQGKQVGTDATAYVSFGGQTIAELKPASGDWNDYVYANGRLLARANSYEDGIEMQGTNTVGTGQWAIYAFPTFYDPNTNALPLIQSGDKLLFRQAQSTTTSGGVSMNFTDGSTTTWTATDQNGDYVNASLATDGGWHYRIVDLSAFVGKSVETIFTAVQSPTQQGSWLLLLADIAIVGQDGHVIPIYNGGPFSLQGPSASSGMTGISYTDRHLSNVGWFPLTTTTFYHGDQVGSARLMTNYYGEPVWSATYLPFGQEWNPQITVNHYKFTGDERDSETNLDHTQFRQYSSQFGRWPSPDPAGLAAVDPSNPQSWNRYAYVINNPLQLTDPAGLHPVLAAPECPTALDMFPQCAGGSPGSLTGSGLGAVLGNNIFDAISGVAGTYLSWNMYGNLSFGFSIDLYVTTHNLVDALNNELAKGSPPFPYVPIGNPDFRFSSTSGWQVTERATGVTTDISGIIPDFLAAAEYGTWLGIAFQQASPSASPYFGVLHDAWWQAQSELCSSVGAFCPNPLTEATEAMREAGVSDFPPLSTIPFPIPAPPRPQP